MLNYHTVVSHFARSEACHLAINKAFIEAVNRKDELFPIPKRTGFRFCRQQPVSSFPFEMKWIYRTYSLFCYSFVEDSNVSSYWIIEITGWDSRICCFDSIIRSYSTEINHHARQPLRYMTNEGGIWLMVITETKLKRNHSNW